MLNNKPFQLNFRIALIMLIAIPLINACFYTGGECNYLDNNRIGVVVGIENDNTVIIETLQPQGQTKFYLAQSTFSAPPKKGQLLDVTVRHHTSGGCEPISVIKIQERAHLTKTFSLTPKHAYAAAFKLSEAQHCTYRKMQQPLELTAEATPRAIKEIEACTPHLTFISTLSETQKQQLLRLNAKTLRTCSLVNITALQHSQSNDLNASPHIIGCVFYEKKNAELTEKHSKKNHKPIEPQVAIKFLFEENNEDRIDVRLIKMY